MNKKGFAPIALSTYTRLSHLVSTVDALKRNTLASESDLFVFSDGAKKGDEQKVEEVRRYLKGVSGFKTLTIVERNQNDRVFNNRECQVRLLKQYGRFVMLEEDIQTAPGFLQFMNDCLVKFKGDKRIVSISGYCPPIETDECCSDAFLLQRFNGWGFATWRQKYSPNDYDFSPEEVKLLRSNKLVKSRLKLMGPDVFSMKQALFERKIEALDVRIMLKNALESTYCVYPKYSLVRNIGHDGSGIHCGISTKFEPLGGELWDKVSCFDLSSVQALRVIEERQMRFRKGSLRNQLGRTLRAFKLRGSLPVNKKSIS